MNSAIDNIPNEVGKLKEKLSEYFNISRVSRTLKVGLCILCHTTIKMTNSNTSGLKRHMINKHQATYQRLFPTSNYCDKKQIEANSNEEDMRDDKLIELVRGYPVLYDPAHIKYNHAEFKNVLWGKIANAMNADANTCKERWSNMRANYRRSVKKSKTLTSQTSKIGKSYKYSSELSFLLKFYVDSDSISNSEDTAFTNSETSLSSNVDVYLSSSQIKLENDVCDPMAVEADKAQEDNQFDDFYDSCAMSEKDNKISTEAVANGFRNHSDTMETFPSALQHPVDAFLAGIAPTLKELSSYSWHLVKGEIFAAVQKYELKMLLDQQKVE